MLRHVFFRNGVDLPQEGHQLGNAQIFQQGGIHLAQIVYQLVAVNRQLIGDKGVELDLGVALVGVNIQPLATGYRTQLDGGGGVILATMAEVPQKAAGQSDAGGVEHEAVFVLYPGADADVCR